MMNTALSRLNAVFAFSLTVLSVLTVVCILTTSFKDKSSTTDVSTQTPNVIVYVSPHENYLKCMLTDRTLPFCLCSKAYENMATGPQQRDRAVLKLNIEAGILHITKPNHICRSTHHAILDKLVVKTCTACLTGIQSSSL